MTAPGGRPVAVVTGGGAGIGAAVAEELGRAGWFVVTVDPLVSLDGSEQLPTPEDTTAGRIVAAGGSAQASSVSVTDREAMGALFEELLAEHHRLDAVVNVAGISRPTSFAAGTEDDWLAVLTVHLGGYLNVLEAALPIMAAQGSGRILGVTSGSGWRSADTGAYGCAKRAVASLTWQLGRHAPAGVTVNAMSPIAVTRMVTAALGARAGGAGGSASATGGLSLGTMPEPEQLGPMAAHLVGDGFGWCSGEVLFVSGPEVAVVERPRLLEVVRIDDVDDLAGLLAAVSEAALIPAEARQVSTGGSNPRVAPPDTGSGSAVDAPPGPRTCAVVTDRREVGVAVVDALEARSVRCATIEVGDHASGFAGASDALAGAGEQVGPLDAVVVALAGRPPAGAGSGWEQILAEHADLVGQIHADAGWTRAVAEHAAAAERPVRLVTLTDASTAGGRSRAQAAAQLARAARRSTGGRVAAFAISDESSGEGGAAVGEVVAHLSCDAGAPELSGAELALGAGWLGLRSHPHPGGSIILGGGDVPDWFDPTVRAMVD